MTTHRFPLLTPCAHAGCHRLTHMRHCPNHLDDDDRATRDQLDEALLERDLALDHYREADARVATLEDRLGVRRS